MDVIAFNRKNHLELVSEWLKARGMNELLAQEVPQFGYICFNDHDAICAGFLRKVEGGYMFMDSLITNPLASPHLRDKAIDIVVTELIESAKDLGITKILANSTDSNTLERSKKHGFRALPERVVIVLEL
jgi:hypothetical protein